MLKSGGHFTSEDMAMSQQKMHNAVGDLVVHEHMREQKRLEQLEQAKNKKGPVFIRGREKKSESESEDSDEDFNDDYDLDLEEIRKKRIIEMQMEYNKKTELKVKEITQDEFLPTTTKSQYVVCHFYKKEFQSCLVVDKHLKELASKHINTRFVKINVEKAPFFVSKLQIKVLPSLIFFEDGIAVDRMVGFEEIGDTDCFKIRTLEKRIEDSGVITKHDGSRNMNIVSMNKNVIQKNRDAVQQMLS